MSGTQKGWHECCIFSGLLADDGAEEAEAADWPAGAPAAHERQPAAAGVRDAADVERAASTWSVSDHRKETL